MLWTVGRAQGPAGPESGTRGCSWAEAASAEGAAGQAAEDPALAQAGGERQGLGLGEGQSGGLEPYEQELGLSVGRKLRVKLPRGSRTLCIEYEEGRMHSYSE